MSVSYGIHGGFDLSVYVILDPDHCDGRDVLWVAGQALDGGATFLQLRAKLWTDRQRLEAARALAPMARDAGATFVVNDRADIARLAGAHGVHVGPDDLPVAALRTLLPDRLIGTSARSLEIALQAQADGVDYLGVGALYDASGVKPDASAPHGPEWVATLREGGVTLPLVGIGGIDATRAEDVIRAGADGVAVIRAVCAAASPAIAASALRDAVIRGRVRAS